MKTKNAITITPEELAQILKEHGFVTKKEVKLLIKKEIIKTLKLHYTHLADQLKEIRELIKKKALGKSTLFIQKNKFVERNIN